MKRIAMRLRIPAICLLLMLLSNGVFSQGLSITGTIEATNAQVSGTVSAGLFSGALNAVNVTGTIKGAGLSITNNAFFGGSLTATGTISAAAITTSGGVIIGGNLSMTGSILSTIPAANAIGMVIQAAPGQTGNLIEFRNSSGAEISAITSGGAFSGTIAALNTTGNIKGSSLTITNNASFGGSITATGTISAAAITTSGGVIVGGNLSATGTITAGAITTSGGIIVGGNLSATGTITAAAITTSGGIIVGGNLSATGTITAAAMTTSGGIIVGGNLSATGTITAQSLTTAGSVIVGGNLSVTGGIRSSSLSATSEIFTNALSVTGNAAVSGTLTATSLSVDNINFGFVTTTSAASSLVLTSASRYLQEITGTNTHTITLPAVATLSTGDSWLIMNNSTGNVTVNSSAGNVVKVLTPNSQVLVTCVRTDLTTAAAWNQSSTNSFITGGGVGAVLTTVANTGTEAVLLSSLPLAADRLVAGTIVRAVLDGTTVEVGAGRITIFRIKIGTLGTTSDGQVLSFSVTGAAGTNAFRTVLELTIRTVGAGGNIIGFGSVINGGTTGISNLAVAAATTAPAPVNTTTSGNIISVTVSASGGTSGTVTVTSGYIEIVNR
jgi:cytoskeletal protein CcmA (bactofilin family)